MTSETQKTQRAQAPEPRHPDLQKQLDSLKAELAHKTADLQEYADHLKRLQADFDNYIKRAEKDRVAVQEFAAERLVTKLLGVLDDVERATHQLRASNIPKEIAQGIDMVFNNFHKALESEGVRAIPAAGSRFDPYKHEVLLQETKEGVAEGTILEELQRGYEMKGRVIRYSKVKVAKTPVQKGGSETTKLNNKTN